jgi:hypothetical protein
MAAAHSPDNLTYHDAIAAIRTEQAMHAARFAEGRQAYDRFYDLAARIGDANAKDVLPDEATVVAELEAKAPDRNRQVAIVSEALFRSLETEMRILAEASLVLERSIIGRLRSDLRALGSHRKESLDGIDGKFWEVVQQGHGAFKQERGRMINRVLAAWCEVYEIKPRTMVEAATIINSIPDRHMVGTRWDMTSDTATERWSSYPFDLISDLGEVRNWDERDPEGVDVLLRHLLETTFSSAGRGRSIPGSA